MCVFAGESTSCATETSTGDDSLCRGESSSTAGSVHTLRTQYLHSCKPHPNTPAMCVVHAVPLSIKSLTLCLQHCQ